MYIRTKDGVYEVSEKTKYAQYSIRGMTMVKNTDFQYISNEKIINQSENLEELCDEFVIEFFASEMLVQVRYAEFQLAEEEFESDKKETLYGAIRVAGKGLIYVAKMNENGELELI